MKPWRIRRLAATSSTNDDAKAAAEAGEAEGLVIHALKQTAGRGRHGRAWESPEGNLYCSVLLRPPHGIQTYGQYSFVASLALFDTVKEFFPAAHVTLKWPNDVLVNGKKISGILLEAGADWLVVGIGLNVLHHPDDALYPATSLYKECVCDVSGGKPLPLVGRGLGRGGRNKRSSSVLVTSPPHPTSPTRGEESHRASFDIDHVLQKLLEHLSHWYDVIQREGFPPIRAAWLENAQKTPMTVKLPDQTVAGDFADIDADGRLILRLADGAERVIATGDVFFAPGE